MSTLMSALEGRLCIWTEWSALCVAGFVTGSSSGSLWDNGIGHNDLQWQDGYPHNKQGKTLADCCRMSSSRVAAADYHLKYIPFLHCPYQNLGQNSCKLLKVYIGFASLCAGYLHCCAVIWFLNNQQFFEIFRIKELLVLVFWEKNQNQISTGSSYFRNIKELAVFMKNWQRTSG